MSDENECSLKKDILSINDKLNDDLSDTFKY